MVPYRPKKRETSRRRRQPTETNTTKVRSTLDSGFTLESGYTSSSEQSSVTQSSVTGTSYEHVPRSHRRRRSSRRTSDLSDLPAGSDNNSFQYEAAKLCKHCHRSPYEIHGRTDVLPALQLDPYSSFSAAYRLTHLSGAPPSPLSPNSPGAPTHLPLHLLPTLSPTERRARRLALALDADDPKLKDWAMEEYVKLGKAGRRLVREGVFEVRTGYQEPLEREDKEELEREHEWAAEQFSLGKVDDVFRVAATILNEMLELQDEGGFGWREGEWGLDTPTKPRPFLLRPAGEPEDESGHSSDGHEVSRTPTDIKGKGKERADSPPSVPHSAPTAVPTSVPTMPTSIPSMPTFVPSMPISESPSPSPAPTHTPFLRTASGDTDTPSEALLKYSMEEAYPPDPDLFPEPEPEPEGHSEPELEPESESVPTETPPSAQDVDHEHEYEPLYTAPHSYHSPPRHPPVRHSPPRRHSPRRSPSRHQSPYRSSPHRSSPRRSSPHRSSSRRTPQQHSRSSPPQHSRNSPVQHSRNSPVQHSRSSPLRHSHRSPPRHSHPRESYGRETELSRYTYRAPASPSPPSDDENVAVSSDIEGSDGGLTTPGASRAASPIHGRGRRHISSGLTTPTRSPSPPSSSAPLFVPARRPMRLKGGAGSDSDPPESHADPPSDPPSPARSPSPSLSADLTPGPPPPSPSPYVMQIPNSVPFIPASLALPSLSDGSGSDGDEPPFPHTAPLPPIQFWLPGFPTYPSPHAQPHAPTPPALFLALGARRACIPYTPAFQGLDLRLVRPISARERLAIKDAVSVLESLGARAFGAGEREGGSAADERRAKGEMWSLSYVGF
ncbi:hypothetical protein DENSPDRAFT_268179 [Dentipellis sp. KUC8613]|nr:hypothetical protein DENSPDRAFT_268179 [Dentipellis sp. KUC8613]